MALCNDQLQQADALGSTTHWRYASNSATTTAPP